MEGWGARTVILNNGVEEKVDAATQKFNRFDEAFHALEWLLARKEKLGTAKIGAPNDERVYVQAGDEIARTPEIWVVFSESDDEVTIWDINVKENENDAG